MAPAVTVLQGLAFFRGGMSAALDDRGVALAGVAGAACRDAADLLILRDPVAQVGQDRRVADAAAGDFDGADLRCALVDSDGILRRIRGMRPPCLRACHAPSLLIRMLSISKCISPLEPRREMSTAGVFRRRDSVLPSRIRQFGPTSRGWLSTRPVVRRNATPNSTVIERQVWIAASL